MPPKVSSVELELVIRLLRKNSSLHAVSSYMKDRELTFSATSWEMMKDERLKPALEKGQLDRGDLLQLLRESEEYGRQHVFLFRTSKAEAAELMNTATLRKRLQALNLLELIDNPRIVERVPGLQLVESRLDQTASGTHLTFKLANVRRYMVQIRRETHGDEVVVTSKLQEDRAIDVVRISADGTAEVRIQSHRNSVDYADEAEQIFSKLAGVTDRLKYEELSLGKARRHLLENGAQLSPSIKFGASTVRSKKGAPINFAAAEWGGSLFGTDDEEVEATMKTLLSKGGGRSKCDFVNCIWLANKLGPSVDIHTFIGGSNNEFVVIPQCSRADYLYVLGKIISYAK